MNKRNFNRIEIYENCANVVYEGYKGSLYQAN